MKVYVDIETYCDVDLKKTGVYPYFESPYFEILLIGYAVDEGPVEVFEFNDAEAFGKFFTKVANAKELIAHNATFERLAFRAKSTHIPRWLCTMVKASYCGLPRSLDEAGKALGLPIQKSASGKALIRYFSMPCKPTKTNGGRTRNLPHHDPEKWEAFKDYLRDDVATTRELEKALRGYTFTEEENYLLDQKINDRGVLLDRDLVYNAIDLDKRTVHALTVEARKLTGLDNPNSLAQLGGWLSDQIGEEINDLRKDTVKDLIARLPSGPARRALEIRQKTSNTSVKKYSAAASYICGDGRARGLFAFYGAGRTGRWAGRGIQLQNLPRNYMKTLDEARDLIKQGDFDTLDFLYDDAQKVLKELTRTMLIPSPGNVFLIADFSAIEARVLAWLAGERWRLDVFETHGKIYEASAAAMFCVPIEEIDKGSPYRQKGKIAELALGYQGAVGALKTMGGEAMGLDDNEMKQIVTRWRKANKQIVNYWQRVEKAAKLALENPQKGFKVGALRFLYNREALTIELPSGRLLIYQKARLGKGRFGEVVKYYGTDQTTGRWALLETYGGKLVENIVQAVSRDLLAFSIKNVDAAGYKIVLHVHDEIVVEADLELYPASLKLERLIAEMIKKPTWAEGLPLDADGFTAKYYQKD